MSIIKQKSPHHIVIAGNIGSGKTSLTQLLTKHYKWIPMFEDVDSNPYLMDFYQDMAAWSFNVQIYFLNLRCKQLTEIQKQKIDVIQDRSIYEDVFIFAACLKEIGLLSERDYQTYYDLYQTFHSFVKAPTLLIYLKSSIPNLVDHIQKRGRDYEENISTSYLKKLNQHYETWIGNYRESPVLTIDVQENHFTENPAHLKEIITKIDTLLKLK